MTEQRRPTDAAYAEAYAAAQPDAGRQAVVVNLEAREFDWEFVPGVSTRAWGFNGTVPGPILEATVGDVLEIRLTNRLPEPTVVHWHGLRIPAAMDGTEMVQRPVGPGEAFTYRFRLPDAGTWHWGLGAGEVPGPDVSPDTVITGRAPQLALVAGKRLDPDEVLGSGTLVVGGDVALGELVLRTIRAFP